jgi:D-3-phosphoglycerate dehydrogenase
MANVLITTRMHESSRARLLQAGHNLVYCDAPGWEEKCAAAKGCAAVACRGGAFPAAFFDALPDLRILALPSAGFDEVDLSAATRHGVWVTNAGDANAVSVAELALMLMLAAAKRLPYNLNVAKYKRPWRGRKQPTFREISGATVALLGYGNIARALGTMCQGFGMRVIAYHPRIAEKQLPPGVIGCDTLPEALREADFVSCHIPARAQNTHLINASVFAMMKPGAIFVNTGRGSVVDENALIDALQNGHLAGAGLDVFCEEPTRKDNPLLFMDNCVCTPHIGGETAQAKIRVYDVAAQNVIRVLSGQPPLSAVNHL